ncbi:hypothetical protein PV326_009817 [Microctonus aethiopoides]|nr:hypothetical protein PV326_009817 [Microctonus aethiopoides]
MSRWRIGGRPVGVASIRGMSLKGRGQQKPRRNPKHTNWIEVRRELALQIKDVRSNFENTGHLDMAVERYDEVVRYSFEDNCDSRTQKETKKEEGFGGTETPPERILQGSGQGQKQQLGTVLQQSGERLAKHLPPSGHAKEPWARIEDSVRESVFANNQYAKLLNSRRTELATMPIAGFSRKMKRTACKCPALAMLRYRCWGIAFLAKDQLAEIGAAELLRFANKAELVVWRKPQKTRSYVNTIQWQSVAPPQFIG